VSVLPRLRRSAAGRVAATALGVVVALGGAPLAGPAMAHAGPQGAPVLAPAPAAHRDPVRDEQRHLKTLDVPETWRLSTGDGVTVAVIDSGVDGTHPDLVGQVLPGTDMVTGGDGRTDAVGHGTTVAAIIAGRGDDTNGVVGIAPKAKILPIRVLDNENRYDDAIVVAKAVRWAVDNGARVINLSLGGNGNSGALAAALDYAFAKDVVVIACTGNVSATGPAEVWYPAREPGVLAVAGLERDGDVLWSGSITGRQTVVSAPATGLLGARPGGYWRVQGTSFAAPMVSAAAALVRSRWPTMSAANVVNRLVQTARDLGPLGRDDEYGFGMVDPLAALTSDVTAVNRNPLDNAPPPGVAGFGSAPDSEPDDTGSTPPTGPVGGQGPGANAGWAAQPTAGSGGESDGGWPRATALFVVVGLGVLLIYRRVNRLV
jgi:type VII secretion-associated serine protease mycosin